MSFADIAVAKAAPGLMWLQGFQFPELAALTRRQSLGHPLGSLGGAGAERWFCDFNEAHQFSLGPSGNYGSVVGATLNAEVIPGPLAAADATSPNLNALCYWNRNPIGTPTTIDFWSDRALGGANELHSSVRIGCPNVNHGFIAYQPFFALGISTGTTKKQFGWVTRVRKNTPGTLYTGAGFFGFSAQLLTPGNILSTAGALTTGANDLYFGFHINTSSQLVFVMNQKDAAAFTITTGVTLGFNFQYLELRGYLDTGGGSDWRTGSYIDAYVDGELVRNAGRAHTVELSDITWDPGSEPISPCMAVVKTAGAQTIPLYQCDLMGAVTNRLIHLTTAPG